ncbi:unnamed protein product [Acanthoscelides obtectus]|uniref:protein-tyrosine-phosphatase n=1 Tax=Acanthoscelides obtectus TaxID=200917 RepID=A0A9P0PNM4_ACAOB|nr:unnamed protein product [Acanthoscelides obtectus]CAK1637987.1 Dual specificity protein phosphatase CDC14A [Acanthoscelides obtectus]
MSTKQRCNVLKSKGSVKLKNTTDSYFFCMDDDLVYDNYYADFGPLNISCLYKFCCEVRKLLRFAKGTRSVVYYTCSQLERKTNAACLIGCFAVIHLGFHPDEIWKILLELSPYKLYIDASQVACCFHLCIQDVLNAVHKAVQFNFFNFEDFNVSEYDMYDLLQYGDINWLVPRKFLAFIGPSENNQGHPPGYYLKYFLKNDVKYVIRLNQACYDSKVFINAGIQHVDLIFPDGTTPPRDVLIRFLDIAEMGPGAIAVHCKAGLGRTGSLIGAYLIKHYHLTAREAIGWMRLCRPGSVIGYQQIWLEKLEPWLWKIGNHYRMRKFGASDKLPRHRYGIYSKQWPLDRERILVEARKKIQINLPRSDNDKASSQLNQKRVTSNTGYLHGKQMANLGSTAMKGNFKALFDGTPDSTTSARESTFYQGVSKLINTQHHSSKSNQHTSLLSQVANSMRHSAPSHQRILPSNAVSGLLTAVPIHASEATQKSQWATQGDKLNEIKVARLMANAHSAN